MNHGDAFAGIGGFGLAAKRNGMSTVWAAEIEPSARAIYSARLGHDGLRFDSDICAARDLPRLDLLTGGFPCQDLSVAGKRRGLTHSDGTATRSGLFFELVRILEESRPEWFVFENVPGLLSHDAGRTMGIVLSTLVECGYGVAWRVLDARFFGVAQRRRRVFIVGHSSGDDRRAAAILFEPHRVRGNSAKGRAAREGAAGTSLSGTLGAHKTGGWGGSDIDTCGAYITEQDGPVGAILSRYGKGASSTVDGHLIAHSLRAEGFDASEDGTGRGTPIIAPTLRCGGMADAERPAGAGPDNVPLAVIQDVQGTRLKKQNGIGINLEPDDCHTLTARDRHAVAFAQNQRGELRTSSVASSLNVGGGKPGEGYPAVLAPTLGKESYSPTKSSSGQMEGFCITSPSPDTDRVRTTTGIPRPLDVCPVCENGPDSVRYRGLGNAVAVPVVRWILRRIEQQHRGKLNT